MIGSNKHLFFYLKREDNKEIFELGTGNWSFILTNSEKLFDKMLLLQELCIISAQEDWFVKPAYILWLRDEIYSFVEGAKEFNLDVAKYGNYCVPNGYKITKTRYDFGAKFVGLVLERYG